MALTTKASATIRGITYKQGDAFTCYYSAKGNGGSEGNSNSAAALTKGKTYYFLGYVVAADSGSTVLYPYKIGSSISTSSAIGYYKEEVFPYATYTITYNANGGSGAPGKQTKNHGEGLTISSTKPTRAGYTFKGWALSKTEADNGDWYYQPGSTCGQNKNLTLYAVWQVNTYTITYNANGGSGAPGSQTKKYGEALTLSSVKPTRADYTFKGWGVSASATTVAYTAGASYTNNAAITLYAIWELSYTKPRITNLKVYRCDSSGAFKDDGTDIRIDFDYDIDKDEIPTVLWSWKASTSSSWEATRSINDANADKHIGHGTYQRAEHAGTIDLEKAYDWQLEVSDSGGSTIITGTVQSLNLAIDVKPPKSNSSGDNAKFGVSVGKTAELRGVFDMGLKAKFREGYIAEPLAAGTDLDTKLTPGWFVGIDETAGTYIHCPEGLSSIDTFALEVVGTGAAGQLMQRLTVCSKENPIEYERFYYSGSWGQWNITSGHKPAMSVWFTANQTTVASSYTKINFVSASSSPGLTLTDGGIKIGEGITKVLVSLTVGFTGIKANGNKHIKIMNNSTPCAWISGYGTAGGDFTLSIPQRVINVSKGDVISATYYSTTAGETISAGSSGNGWKTCLTVEAV